MSNLIPSTQDRRSAAVPLGNYKKDFNIYGTPGRGGGTGVSAAGVTRQVFWIDFNPFDVYVRSLITQNNSFQVWSTATGSPLVPTSGTNLPMYFTVAQSDDIPDNQIVQSGLFFPQNQILPYYVNTNYITQPLDPNFQNDQGYYVYYAYQNNGLGIAKTGTNDGILQAVRPSTSYITALFLNDLFRAGSTSDHTKYDTLYFDLYDANMNFVANIGGLNPQFPISSPVGNQKTTVQTTTFVTADDSNKYWTNAKEVHIIPPKPIAVQPFQTYYILIRQTTTPAAYTYAVGSNTDSNGNYNGQGFYLYGQAYLGTKSGAVWSKGGAVGTNINICFVTQRNKNRAACIFYWGQNANPTGAYWYPPASFPDQFKFVAETADRRI